MAQNYRKLVDGLNLVPKTTTASNSLGDLEVLSSTNKLYFHNGTVNSEVLTGSSSAVLTNKLLDDATVYFVDTVDNTKAIKFDVTGTTGTSTTLLSTQTSNQILTMPDATDTLVARATTDTLTNKSIDALTNTITNISNSNLSGSAAISNANLASMAAHTIKGNNTASPGLPLDLTGTQVTAELDVFTDTLKGLVPASGGGTVNFLRADGTFSIPPNPGGTINNIGTYDSQAPSANGLVISGAGLYAQSASVTVPGMVNNIAQSFSGLKSFTNNIASNSISDISGGLTVSSSAGEDVTIQPDVAGRLITNVSTGIDMQQVSSPTPPAAGHDSLYFKSNDRLYSMNAAGQERTVGSGGSGGINFLTLDTSFQPINTDNFNFEASLGDWATYNNGGAAGTIAQDLTAFNSGLGVTTSATLIGQKFLALISGTTDQVTFEINNPTASMPGNLVCNIYSDSAGLPGTLLATSDPVNSATFNATPSFVTFTFTTPASLGSGVVYHAAIDFSGVTFSGGNFNVLANSTNPYPSGNVVSSTNSGASWFATSGTDLYFDIQSTGTGGILTLTGGSSSLVMSRTTTSGEVLDGDASLKVVKSAVDSQNQGISCLANIPLGYRGQISNFLFPFKVLSGSLVQGDLEVVAYDVTNSALLTVFNPDVISTGLIGGQLSIPANCEEIRFGVNFASSSAIAVTYSIDDVTFGPQTLVATINEFGIIGQIVALSTTEIPVGTLLCDGSAVSRSGYNKLFNAIGTAYGIGDGSTTFNLPDFRGLFLRGQDEGSGNDPDAASRTATNGGNSGDNIGSYQDDAFESHAHAAAGLGGLFGAGPGGANWAVNSSTGAAGGNETRPKNVYVRYVIIAETPSVITQETGPFSIAKYLATGTRVVGTAPTKLGEYRSYLRDAGTFSYNEPLGTPTDAPSSANGIKMYGGTTYVGGDNPNSPSKYEIFIGKNKLCQIQWYLSAGRTGFLSTDCMQEVSTSKGVFQNYDPTTGIITLVMTAINGTNYVGCDSVFSNINDGYFDVFVSEQIIPVQTATPSINLVQYTADDTYIVPSGIKYLKIKAAGGGGGGGASTASGGGGSGAYFEYNIANLAPGVTIPITIGIGGGATAAGGDTIIGGPLNVTIGGGGAGGSVAGSPAAAPGGAGGTVTGAPSGSIAIDGGYGMSGFGAGGIGYMGGGGNTPFFGGGGRNGPYPVGSYANPGTSPGAGGGGGYTFGAAGANGIVIIEEYYYF